MGAILHQKLELRIRDSGGLDGGRVVVVTGELVVVVCTNVIEVGVSCIEFSEVYEDKLVRVLKS